MRGHPARRGKSYFAGGKWVPEDVRNIRPYVVYVIESDYGVKIGISAAELMNQRLAALELAAGIPMRLIRTYDYRDRYGAFDDEQEAHVALQETRTFGEWFQCHPLEATDVLERIRHRHRKEAA